jgi:2-polyprenyl-6-hydroxyphenyl methylase/3-demethylubiquinone-9 3-methyltransferase
MINKLVQFFKIKVLRINSDRWDYQYAKGMWDGLRDQEMERILVAKDMLERYVNGGNVLEIGCGEGIFFNQIPENIYSFYEGIDISKVAIDKIEPSFKSLFKVADMETYQPNKETYSVIVFNEVLYYSNNPINLLRRYSKFLDDKGILIIGMYLSAKSLEIWQQVHESFNILESKDIQQDAKSWVYTVIQSKM